MKRYKKLEEFINILVKHDQENPHELFPPCINTQFAIDCLCEAFLGPDYYITLPCGNAQGNTIILDEILRTHSKKYRKLVKRKQKELRGYGKKTKSSD